MKGDIWSPLYADEEAREKFWSQVVELHNNALRKIQLERREDAEKAEEEEQK